MTPQQWLKNVLQNGSNLSGSSHFALSLIASNDEETLWELLILLSGCFSDLIKAGEFPSLPQNLDLPTAALTFMHLSDTMGSADQQLRGPGSTPMDMPE